MGLLHMLACVQLFQLRVSHRGPEIRGHRGLCLLEKTDIAIDGTNTSIVQDTRPPTPPSPGHGAWHL